MQLRLILKWRYIRVHHLAFAVGQKCDRPYDKKRDRLSPIHIHRRSSAVAKKSDRPYDQKCDRPSSMIKLNHSSES
ncbi:hypothetical protein [Microcoleus sp. D2_18a_B4]|uniref:hypothetical protein n=1 Tax=Microcoleus sp. D2_18a_B4 TaxID=3055329 RepID=UPI002FCE9C14